MSDIKQALEALIETLASIEHDRWSHWQRYLHSKCIPHDEGLLIPNELVKRWEAQISTAYSALSETAKESDREQVRKYLPIIVEALSQK